MRLLEIQEVDDMSTIAEENKSVLREERKITSLFDKLTKLFLVSEEYAAGYFMKNGSYTAIIKK